MLIWCLIYPVTDIYTRFFSSAVIKKGAVAGKKVCLTFDDGPDYHTTPLALGILREERIPALFFLVGSKAEQIPELVKRIVAEGHEIGMHTYFHRHAYLMFFRKSFVTIKRGKQVLEGILNRELSWFRPPWGALNLFQYWWLRFAGLKIVLWTANARDWSLQTGAPGIVERLLGRVRDNSIIVLHDSGGDAGAPENMIKALPVVIKELKAKGYLFVSLPEILGGKQ